MACEHTDQRRDPPPEHQRLVDPQNELLRTELGLRLGQPRVQWLYSETLLHPMRVMDETGALKWDWRCQCGLNVHESQHTPECTRFLRAEPCYAMRLLARQYYNSDQSPLMHQWVLWSWVPPPTPEDWAATFGDQLDYAMYRNGSYEPIHAGATAIAIRTPDEPPTIDTTWWAIRKIRQRETLNVDDLNRQAIANWNNGYESRRLNIKDRIKDKFPMGNIPGKKWGVSFPQTPYKKRSRSTI